MADPSQKICRGYQTLIPEEGIATRATFIIGPKDKVKAFEFHNKDLGRNIDELIRKIQALERIEESEGELCPVNWSPGDKTVNG
mgnify:FL=1